MATFSDETVMRYIDGELDDATCAEIEAARESDAELSARLDMFARTRLAAQDALRPMLDEPVPDRLRASVEAMVAKSKQSTPGGAPAWRVGTAHPDARALAPANDWRRLAAAACIAGVLAGAAGYMLAGRTGPAGLQIADVDPAALSEALRSTPSGGEQPLAGSANNFRVIASFRDGQQSLCREFELDRADRSKLTSVACHKDGQWLLRFAVNTPGDAPGYAPASGLEALNAYLAAIEAGQPLSAEEESQALEQLPAE